MSMYLNEIEDLLLLLLVVAIIYLQLQTDNNKQNSPAFKQCDVKFVPIFLGGLMNACGNTPPIAIKSKSLLAVNIQEILSTFLGYRP